MKYPMYSIRDKKTAFGFPFTETNDGTAKRGFTMAINSGEGVMSFAYGDYELYRIGEFDTDKGVIFALDIPVLVCSGDSVFNGE